MKTYIAFLRGINVGGHRKVPMAKLIEFLTKANLQNVTTYIQSGNIVFQSENTCVKALEKQIQSCIAHYFGFDVVVIVKTRPQLVTIVENCPFSESKKENSYFAMLGAVPNGNLVNEASQKTYENEEYAIDQNCIYVYCANGYGKAKFNLSFFERKLKVNATARNFKTMHKLLELSSLD